MLLTFLQTGFAGGRVGAEAVAARLGQGRHDAGEDVGGAFLGQDDERVAGLGGHAAVTGDPLEAAVVVALEEALPVEALGPDAVFRKPMDVARLAAWLDGSGLEIVNEIFGGTIPGQFIPAVEKGIHDVMDTGAIAGYPIQDIRVAITDGKHHPVDSKEVAFRTAGDLLL